MNPTALDQALDAVEQQLDAVSGALFASDPEALEHHGAALRQASAAFAQALQAQGLDRHPPAGLRARMQRVAAHLSSQRDALARTAAAAERQAACLLPRSESAPTYGPAFGSGTSTGPARIYRNAAN